jgi:hypothetical protein
VKTVISRIVGGLGNQMFQYALGKQLSLSRAAELMLDLSVYAHPDRNGPEDTIRDYRLDDLNIQAGTVLDGDLKRITRLTQGNIHRICYHIPGLKWTWVSEGGVTRGLDDFAQIAGNLYLDGWWQSERYFRSIREVLLKEFTPRIPFQIESQRVLSQIESCTAVSIHVRRGDYVHNPITNAYHGVCSMDYYQAAIRIIDAQVQSPHFFVFSDDLSWVRENLPISHPVEYVSIQEPDLDVKEMALMSHCKHHIIANSSFSWWGAWLNARPDKIVIGPKKWFAQDRDESDWRTPSGWLRV